MPFDSTSQVGTRFSGITPSRTASRRRQSALELSFTQRPNSTCPDTTRLSGWTQHNSMQQSGYTPSHTTQPGSTERQDFTRPHTIELDTTERHDGAANLTSTKPSRIKRQPMMSQDSILRSGSIPQDPTAPDSTERQFRIGQRVALLRQYATSPYSTQRLDYTRHRSIQRRREA
jgi:hypothetical protein